MAEAWWPKEEMGAVGISTDKCLTECELISIAFISHDYFAT
jgi:hypothetical protein